MAGFSFPFTGKSHGFRKKKKISKFLKNLVGNKEFCHKKNEGFHFYWKLMSAESYLEGITNRKRYETDPLTRNQEYAPRQRRTERIMPKDAWD